MLLYALSAFYVAAFGLSASGEYTLPVTTCKHDTADYSACLKRAVEEAWPRFVAGLPELDFPPLDPLIYEHEKFVFNTNEIRAEAITSNITIVGLTKAHFLNVTTHFSDDVFNLKIDVQIPKIHIKGGVYINGTLSVFRINNNGHFNLTVDDVRATLDIIGHVINDTWIVEHFHVAPSFAKMKFYLDHLVEQSKEINDIVVTFINEFWPALYRALLPFLTKAWEPWFTTFPNKIFSKVSFSKIFP